MYVLYVLYPYIYVHLYILPVFRMFIESQREDSLEITSPCGNVEEYHISFSNSQLQYLIEQEKNFARVDQKYIKAL